VRGPHMQLSTTTTARVQFSPGKVRTDAGLSFGLRAGSVVQRATEAAISSPHDVSPINKNGGKPNHKIWLKPPPVPLILVAGF
jgi:hypothetical protein